MGHDAIKADWVDPEPFTMSAAPVAVDGPVAVARVEVRYGEPARQEYRDLWVMRFADDGRVEDFEEWAYWPGRSYSADHTGDPGDGPIGPGGPAMVRTGRTSMGRAHGRGGGRRRAL